MKKLYYDDGRTRVSDELVSDDISKLIIPLHSIIETTVERTFPFWRSHLVIRTNESRRHVLRKACFKINLLRDIADAIADAANDAAEREGNKAALDTTGERRIKVGERLKESGDDTPLEVMNMFGGGKSNGNGN